LNLVGFRRGARLGWPRTLVDSPSGRDAQINSSLEVGRAYLETGALQDADQHLHTAAQRQRDWEYEGRIATRSFLTYVLAQFYLGRVCEREGKKTEAINAYQDFLNHFENSTARLPQIAEARTALKRWMR